MGDARRANNQFVSFSVNAWPFKTTADSTIGVDFRHGDYANFLVYSGNIAAKKLKDIYGKVKLMEDR